MIVPSTVHCDVCNAVRGETNHWLVAVASEATGAISFFSPHELMDPLDRNGVSPHFRVADLCGQKCAHTYLSRWLEANTAGVPTHLSESETR